MAAPDSRRSEPLTASELFERFLKLLVAADGVGTEVTDCGKATGCNRDTDGSPPEDDADDATEESGDDTDDCGLLGGVTERNRRSHGRECVLCQYRSSVGHHQLRRRGPSLRVTMSDFDFEDLLDGSGGAKMKTELPGVEVTTQLPDGDADELEALHRAQLTFALEHAEEAKEASRM